MKHNEIICKINKIEKRIKYLSTLPIYNYNKKLVHKKQLAFHECELRNRWVFGGNRSGKTECGAVEVIYMARGNHPHRKIAGATSGWVVSLSSQVGRDVAQQKILHYLDPTWIKDVVMQSGKKEEAKGGVIDYILVNNIFGTVSRIAFKSCDQGREKFQGTSLNYVWFDEEPPKDIYDECRMRVLDTCGDIFGTMTPLKGLTWVYNEIYLNEFKNPQVWCTFMSWADNPYLNHEELELLSGSMSSSDLESRKYGRFIQSQGAVYTEFCLEQTVIEPFDIPSEWYSAISIDPGFTNPTAALWFAKDFDDNIYVINEHYHSGKTVEWHANSILEACKRLKWPLAPDGSVTAIIDSAALQRTLASEKSVAELFLQHKINVQTKVNKDLFTGIQKVKSLLLSSSGKRKLFVFKNCVNLIREFKSYWWGANEAPTKKDDHALDALRYYVNTDIANKSTVRQKNIIQKNMERLIKINKYL